MGFREDQDEYPSDAQTESAGLSPSIFDGRYDSSWWEATRGSPPMHVLVGVWMIHGIIAAGALTVVWFVIFGGLLAIGIGVGAVGQYESTYTGPVIAFHLIGATAGVAAGWRLFRPAVRATRLRLLLKRHTEKQFDRAYSEHERQCLQADSPRRDNARGRR